MGKRRRERDRPKVPPDAMYNPNKRVHLSYADSDDEDDTPIHHEPPAFTGQIDVKTVPVDGQSGATNAHEGNQHDADQRRPGDDGLDNSEPADEESSLLQSEVDDDPAPSSARASSSKSGVRHEQRRRPGGGSTKRATEMLSGCIEIPSAGARTDDEGEGSDQEVARYIRSVQTQRSAIPQILSAPDPQQQEQGDDDEAGYDDDAYYARHRSEDTRPPDLEEDSARDPQMVFTSRLLERFHHLRAQLRMPTTMDALSALGEDRLISFPPHNKPARKAWRKLLHSCAPATAQLQSIDESTALRLLDLIQETCMPKATNLSSELSAWIWALLARLDDVGNMYNDDVFPLRQLGKKALYVHLSFANPDAAAGIEALEGDEETRTAEEGVEDTVEEPGTSATDSQEQTTVVEDPVRGEDKSASRITDNTAATLDMILTVVGEVFGQKDLLQFRQSWKE